MPWSMRTACLGANYDEGYRLLRVTEGEIG